MFQLSFQIWTSALLLIFNNLVLTEATWGSNYGQNSNNLVILSIDTDSSLETFLNDVTQRGEGVIYSLTQVHVAQGNVSQPFRFWGAHVQRPPH